jgi:hypothetical protein
MTKDEALKLALEALKRMKRFGNTFGYRSHEQNPYEQVCEAIDVCEKAIAAPVQEPVAWMSASRFEELQKGFTVMTTLTKQRAFEDDVAIHTIAPAAQRQWVGLTDEEKRQIFEREDYQGWLDYINAIEAKLKEKNT